MKQYTISEAIDSFGVNAYTWKVFFLIGIAMIFDGFDYQLVAYTMPQIAAEWGLNSVQTGSLTSWSLVGLIIGGAISGIIADKIGRKKTLVGTIFLYSLFTFPIFFVNSFTSFCILRVLTGIGLGACIPVCVTINSEYAPGHKRALFLGCGACFMTFGWFLAGLVGRFVIPIVGWRVCYLLGGIPLLYAIYLYFQLTESIHWLAIHDKRDKAAEIIHRIEKAATGQTSDTYTAEGIVLPPPPKTVGLGALFTHKYLRITLGFWLFYFMSSFIVYGVNSWLPSLLLEKGLSFNTSYGYSIAQNGAAIVASAMAGILTELCGRKKGIIIGFLCSGVAILIMAFVGNELLPVLFACMFLGLTINFTNTAAMPLVTETYRTEFRSTGLAWVQTIGRLAGVVSPIFLGLLLSKGSDFSTIFLWYLVPVVLGILIVQFVIKTETKGKTFEEIAEDEH